MKAIITIIAGLSFMFHSTTTSANGPCSTDPYKAFDFWLGYWEVHDKSGKLQGTNRIEKSADGCFIHENWTAGNNSTGYSINYYNPVTEKWSQKWVSAGSVIEYSGKIEKAGELVLEGMIYYQQSKQKAKFRGTWTLLEDGRVRQFFEQHDKESDEWKVWFEGFYSKKNKQ